MAPVWGDRYVQLGKVDSRAGGDFRGLSLS